jgi:pyridoxal phosphate enzyme (YggS family)
LKLLKEIGKEAAKNNQVIDVLLQVHIAEEETKFGLDENELGLLVSQFEDLKLTHVRVSGLMGMASFTNDMEKVRSEFIYLASLFQKYRVLYPGFTTLSMGMSSDYKTAVEEGSNLVRIGSLIFGERTSMNSEQ